MLPFPVCLSRFPLARTDAEREREEDREVSGQRAGVLRRGLGFVAGRASRPPERQPSWWQEVAWT